MIEEVARHKCTGGDGSPLVVVQYRHVFQVNGSGNARRYGGAAWSTLLDGEPVRYIDAHTFEVVATGELMAHDPKRCDCLPAAGIATRTGAHESWTADK